MWRPGFFMSPVAAKIAVLHLRTLAAFPYPVSTGQVVCRKAEAEHNPTPGLTTIDKSHAGFAALLSRPKHKAGGGWRENR
jgi:hypothetical protein